MKEKCRSYRNKTPKIKFFTRICYNAITVIDKMGPLECERTHIDYYYFLCKQEKS